MTKEIIQKIKRFINRITMPENIYINLAPPFSKKVITMVLFLLILGGFTFIISNKITKEVYVARLKGGLGNQMFFLAGQLTYAKHFNKDICLTGEKDLTKAFNIPFRRCSKDEVLKAKRKACSFLSPSSFFERSDCLTIQKGYLQNELFFKPERDYVKNLFSFKKPLPHKLKQLAKQIKNKNSVSIHIRRGDYLERPQSWPIISLSYYEKGADYIQSKSKKPIHLFVFSNDTEWVIQNFKSKYPFTIVPKNSTIDDLHLMTLCHHNIIANSTFSWWGAYLNKNKDKIIIAPDKWHKKHLGLGEALILKEWIILPAN